MKKLMLILALGAFGVTAVNAQQTTPPPQTQQTPQQETQRVQIDDLPDAVKESMDNKFEDKDAQIVSIDRGMKEGKQVYEITYRKDEKTWKRKYDQEGNELDKDKKRDDE